MPLQSLLKCLDTRKIEAVRVPDILRMESVEMLCHSILLPLMYDVVLVLGQAVDSVKPTLALVLGQDVGGRADLAGNVILDPRPGVRGALTSPAPLQALHLSSP